MIYRETLRHHEEEFICRCGEVVTTGDTEWGEYPTEARACSRTCLLEELDAIRDRGTLIHL